MTTRYPIILWNPVIKVIVGGMGFPQDLSLRNPTHDPMLISEIRFCPGDLGLSESVNSETGTGNLMIDVRLGQVPLTNGFVPAPIVDRHANTNNSTDNFTWRLKRPMFVAPDQTVKVAFRNGQNHDVPSIPATGSPDPGPEAYGRVALVGHVFKNMPLSEYPKTTWVPFVSYWTAPDYVNSSNVSSGLTDTSVESTQADLVNPLDSDLYVEQFVGVLLTSDLDQLAAGGYVPDQDWLTPYQNWQLDGASVANLQAYTRDTLIQMVDWLQRPAIRDLVPFANVFSQADGIWPVGTWIPPKAFFIARLEQNYSNLDQSNSNLGGVRTMIGLSGSREVVLG